MFPSLLHSCSSQRNRGPHCRERGAQVQEALDGVKGTRGPLVLKENPLPQKPEAPKLLTPMSEGIKDPP